MTNVTVILLVIMFSAANIGLGVSAAGFFGIGPLRNSSFVRFLSDPVFPRRARSAAPALPTTGPADASGNRDTASDNTASDNTASDNTASDNTASDNTASDNTASDNTASAAVQAVIAESEPADDATGSNDGDND
jgi:hypothetical protein